MSKLEKVLDQAEEDLKNAELRGLAGKLTNPVFDNILAPATSLAANTLPKVVDVLPIPFLDEASSGALNLGFGAVKFGYSIFPLRAEDDLGKESQDLHKGELEEQSRFYQKSRPVLSSATTLIGGAINVTIDLLRLPFSGDLREWAEATKQFVGYLAYSGVGSELTDAFLSPGSVSAMKILADVQGEKDNNGKESRRIRTAMDSWPVELQPGGEEAWKLIMEDAVLYGKYSTIAYGIKMIQSSEFLNVNGHPLSYAGIGSASERRRKQKMAKYVDIEPDDIIDLTKPGGDIDIIGYVLAIHRAKSTIVLAFRGTFTVSGFKTDAAAYSAPFCDGVAHSGIAERTLKIWDHLQDQIVQLLKDNPGFELVITGHSLGAGVASLLTLKLKHERILATMDASLANVNVRCFAYACPPVYLAGAESELPMAEIMKSVYAFLHETDVVPFCSVDSLRRVAATISAVNDMTNPVEGLLMATGRRDVPSEIVDKINEIEESDLPYAPGSEKLAIPTSYIVWVRRDGDEKDRNEQPVFNAMFCRPCTQDGLDGTNDLTIRVDKDMISEHMMPEYELALRSIKGQLDGDVKCYIFPSSEE